ncbi:unannotated protein [freshwater metagenome]|uniref:Unannotated protein n=1 Tax=freshwater metagenome TaxID=449393 RepID=A0A6J7M606_9ZZZZ|nr:DUF4193 family protein [Actinomycetota bacterium]MSV94344.1 DUF4193 family protein [Actinomycetota bacterium]MSW61409.1 DUF4193 family protein [Actinomycetota bacterium]MSY45050.1 DUF4193 family protein [Actinomycetota bacterium]
MSEEISEEIASIDLEIDAEEIDVLEVDDEDTDVLEVDVLEVDDEFVPDVEIAVEEALKVRPATTKRSGEEVVDMAEESDPDDVETPLDAILAEKTASTKLEDEEAEIEEDEITIDERTDDSERIVPKQPGEFHCSACFLLLPRGQLADEERLLCKDCV